MKTVLIICESGYWRDLRDELAQVGCQFLGFDKKKPNRSEIDSLVGKADFVVIRNLNVAHHSVSFAKEAAKATAKPFWVGRNFGAAKVIELLKVEFPEENFVVQKKSFEKSKPKQLKNKKKSLNQNVSKTQHEATSNELQQHISSSKKNLPLKTALKDIKLDDDDIDFAKLFKS